MTSKPHFATRTLVIGLILALASLPAQPLGAQIQCNPLINIDSPDPGSTLSGPVTFTGWAVDQNSQAGSGISSVQLVLDGPLGGSGLLLGSASPVARPDVDAALGRIGTFGFKFTTDVSQLAGGPHTFYVYASTYCGPSYSAIEIQTPPSFVGQVE